MSNRKPFIAGNWKLNKNASETKEFTKQLQAEVDAKGLANIDIAVVPTFTSLHAAELSSIKLGAQDLATEASGAFTGEVSAEMLIEAGVTHVLVGHSERREIFKEDDSVINAKVLRALDAGLKVIFCCGESLETREAGSTDQWVAKQIETGLAGVSVDNFAENIVIAYEPIWAIGTGKTCDSAEANRTIAEARKKVSELFGAEAAAGVRIQYGGSVKPATIEEQMAQSDIDGALVGGASLKVEDFVAIIEGAQATATA